MLRALASLFFYARFYSQFSAAGLRRRRAGWKPYDQDLSGQTWLITGASGGIGRAIALQAHERGATVLAAARNRQKLDALRAEAGNSRRFEVLPVDFSLLADTRRFAAKVIGRSSPLTVLVNNVGVLLNQYQRTAEGLESSLVSNLLSHYLLTETLVDADAIDPAGVIINMSSGGMYGAALDLKALTPDPATYDGMAAYAQHKRAQVELTRHWNQQWQGCPKAHVMHPGWVDTEGVQSSLPWFRATLQRRLRTPADAADTTLWLGSTRPPPAAAGIWLDRVRDDEHAFAFTRKARPTPTELAEFLSAQIQRASAP
ncbi:MAG: SDR family NAD(P)-dependent oxidoreductase [Lysobacterales bacterium]